MLNSTAAVHEPLLDGTLDATTRPALLRGWRPLKPFSGVGRLPVVDSEHALETGKLFSERRAIEAALASLTEAWKQVDAVFGTLPATSVTQILLLKPIDLRHPFLFYMGHLPAFAWNRYNSRLLPEDALPIQPPLTLEMLSTFAKLFERGMDPDVDDPTRCHWHSQVPSTAEEWPPVFQVAAYRDYIRQDLSYRLRRWSESVDDQVLPPSSCYTLLMTIAEHEWMHTETLLYMLHQLNGYCMRPFWISEYRQQMQSLASADALPMDQNSSYPPLGATQRVESDGIVSLGRNPHEVIEPCLRFAWDNELPRVQRKIPRSLLVQRYPVTNLQYWYFVQAGGYRELDRYWLNESDRQWCARSGRQWPQFWRALNRSGQQQSGPACYVVHPDGRLGEHALGEPACVENHWPVYVTLAEARAFANWVSGALGNQRHPAATWRLPTEAEWQHLAEGAYPDSALDSDESSESSADGNYGFRHWGPISTYESPNCSRWGVCDLVGNGWEWTESLFEPLDRERFQPSPLYPEYSADFFDDKHFVLKGASWATGTPLVRSTFRNWYQAHYPYVFAKFRLVCEEA